MKETITLMVVISIYTVSMFGAGMLLATGLIRRNLDPIRNRAWDEGCHMCAQFEKDQQARDQLQGVDVTPIAPTH